MQATRVGKRGNRWGRRRRGWGKSRRFIAAWTMEELLANRADLLKAELAEAADRCARALAGKVPT